MKFLALVDESIDLNEAKEVAHQFTNFYQVHTSLVPQFLFEPFTYKNIPLEADNDGDLKPTRAWFKKTIQCIYDAHGDSIDHVVLWVHRDNWTFKGIWGSNFSNIWNGYHVQLCRFDDRNQANSFGTLYHEVMHSHDALIYTMLGEPVNLPLSYDKFYVHGGRPDNEGTTQWKYIRHQENTDALRLIASQLKRAYAKRRELYRLKQKKTIVYLAQQVLVLLRQLMTRKYGRKV